MCITSNFKHAFLSTLSLRRATHYDNYNLHCTEISIHALLAESDPKFIFNIRKIINFYPRSPCGERPHPIGVLVRIVKFLSTLSLRRATQWEGMKSLSEVISIHALLAESDVYNKEFRAEHPISIHALLAESDVGRAR